MASSSISLPGDVAEPKEKFSIEQLQSVNEEQRISTFNLSDGPLSVCLNVYVSNRGDFPIISGTAKACVPTYTFRYPTPLLHRRMGRTDLYLHD